MRKERSYTDLFSQALFSESFFGAKQEVCNGHKMNKANISFPNSV